MRRTIAIDGLTVAVERPDAPHVPSHPPVLLIHGLFAGAWVFEKYQRFLAAQGFPTWALDLRGHHASRPVPALGRVSVQDYVEDALAVARAAAAEHDGTPPMVVGHSMGGLIAQKVAEAGMARALVLVVSAPPRGIPLLAPRVMAKQLKYLPRILRSLPIAGSLAETAAVTFNRCPPEEHGALHARLVPDSGRAGREMSLGAVRVEAARVTCPVLVVAAREDRFIPRWIQRRIARRYGAEYREFADHAHFLPWEPGWEEPAGVIARWLADVAARTH